MKKIFLLIVFFTVFTLPVRSESVEYVKQAIVKQAQTMNVDPAIVLSIAKAESGFNQNARGGGAVGVFQLLPATARNMGYNPYNLDENIKAGITYYKNMYNQFGSMELAVAAYNAGPVAVKRINGIPHHSKHFVNRVMADYRYYKQQ